MSPSSPSPQLTSFLSLDSLSLDSLSLDALSSSGSRSSTSSNPTPTTSSSSTPSPITPPSYSRIHNQTTHHTGAHTAPLLAAFPAPPPTSLALRLSLHLPKTSLFFDEEDADAGFKQDDDDDDDDDDARADATNTGQAPLASLLPPPHAHARKASLLRRTPPAASALARSPSQSAKWRGRRFTQVSTTSSASVSTGYRTCMRADALAALEGRVLGPRGDAAEGDARGGGRAGEKIGGGAVLMSTWSDEEEEEEDLWEDDGRGAWEEQQQQQQQEAVSSGTRGEMSWMDFNEFGGKGSYKCKSMYSISTSADTEEGAGRPFSASSTSLPDFPFPSSSASMPDQTPAPEAVAPASPTTSPAAMRSPPSYSSSFALPPLASLTDRARTRPGEGGKTPPKDKTNARQGRGMPSFMFIDTEDRTARTSRRENGRAHGGFGKSFIDF